MARRSLARETRPRSLLVLLVLLLRRGAPTCGVVLLRMACSHDRVWSGMCIGCGATVAEPELPRGWSKHFSNREKVSMFSSAVTRAVARAHHPRRALQRHYFFNSETGERFWTIAEIAGIVGGC